MKTTLSEASQFLLDFNVQDVAIGAGLDISVSDGASILNLDAKDAAAYIAEVDGVVQATANQMMSDDAQVRNMVEQLHAFKRVLLLGDSITTYRYSYARLLRHLLKDSEVINHGYSGYTSNHGLELTHTRFVQLQPDLVFIKYGVNDCKHFAGTGGRTLVSVEEYRGNIVGMIRAFQMYTSAKVILLTPTPVVEPIVAANEDYKNMYLTWQNTDLARFSSVVKDVSETYGAQCVDLFNRFGMEPDAALYLADGLHPNFAGHQVILKTIIELLTS